MNLSQTPIFWLNMLSRDLLTSGMAKTLIDQRRISGFTLDASSLEPLIGAGTAYDDAISEFGVPNGNLIFDSLAIQDAQAAADLLRPIFEQSDGSTGFVSVDLSPRISQEGAVAQLAEAKRLFRAINRPNVMIKVPGRVTDLTAIEEMLFTGININVTMVYSAANAVSVAGGYIRALERRLYAGLPVDKVASVITFGLNGIDSSVDKMLEGNIRSAQSRSDVPRVSLNSGLLGKAAIANARDTIRRLNDLFHGERFLRIRAAGGRIQTLVLADTQPSAPQVSPLHYLEQFSQTPVILQIGMPTLDAVSAASPDGQVKAAVAVPDDSREVLDKFAEVGIDLELLGRGLQGDAEEFYAETFNKLIARVEGKRNLLFSGFMRRQTLILGELQRAVETELNRLRAQKSITRTWMRDASLWKDSFEHIRVIEGNLGWLTICTDSRIDRERLNVLRESSRINGWQQVLLLGMGGAILPAQVMASVFGQQAGFPELLVLDSTDPQAIRQFESRIDPAKTLVIVTSKSGKTLETVALREYFFAQFKAALGDKTASHFITITDPGSPLDSWAHLVGVRHAFQNPTDMTGAYQPLSYAGLVPAALLGLEYEKIIDRGAEMQTACADNVMGVNHPGLWLGAVMATMAASGLNKLTMIMHPDLITFGEWVEQVVSESTGKEGKGIVTVLGPTSGMPHDYSDDRLFVYMRLEDKADNPDEAAKMLQEAGFPMVILNLRDKYDVGAEFYRWMFGSATAAMCMRVNPFEVPDSDYSRSVTERHLELYRTTGKTTESVPEVEEDGVSLFADERTASLLRQLREQHNYTASPMAGLIAAFLSLSRSGQYIALLPFLNPTADNVETFQRLRRRMRHIFKRAIKLGFGPRYLHIAGQLHKGGPNIGRFILFTVDDEADIQVPGMPFTFGIIKAAQAAGDLEALASRERRVIRLHLGKNVARGLEILSEAIEAVAEKRR